VGELDHVGIAVPNLTEAIALWRSISGGAESAPEEVPSNRVRVVFFTVGGTHIELLEPTDPESPIARFLASRGPGVHHLAFHVSNREFDAILRRIKKAKIVFGSAPWSLDDGKLNDWGGGRGVYFQDPNGHVLELMTVPQ